MLKIETIYDLDYYTLEPVPKPSGGGNGRAVQRIEAEGTWWCRNNWIVEDAARADRVRVMRLGQGRHPVHGRQIVSGKGDKRRAGFALMFGAPKAWSALWAVSDEDGRRALIAMLEDAVREVLDAILEHGLIEVRIGKGGKIRASAVGLVAALYTHLDSRAGDPQVHVHVLLLNVGQRRDGQVRAINCEELYDQQKVYGALFRLKLACKLEALGVAVRADLVRGFTIIGQPIEMLRTWSTRSGQIIEAVEAKGLPQTAGYLKVVDRIAKVTRGSKIKLPLQSDLGAKWRKEAVAEGWISGTEWWRLDRPPTVRTVEQETDAAGRIVGEALQEITEIQSLFYAHDVEALALTLAVGRTNARAIGRAVRGVLASPQIDSLKANGLLTSMRVKSEELEIIRIARGRVNDPVMAFDGSVVAALLDDFGTNDEREDIIRHVLGSASVCAVDGGSKFRSTEIVRALQTACRHGVRRLNVLTPVNAKVVAAKHSSEMDHSPMLVEDALRAFDTGTIQLKGHDVVLVDDAAQLSRSQMLRILRETAKAGAKLILYDDRMRRPALNRSNPFALISRTIGTQRVQVVRRQEVEWQRRASLWANMGWVGKALVVYHQNGAVQILESRTETSNAIMRAFKRIGGDAVTIVANNGKVADVNVVMRNAAREIGAIGADELLVRAMPRGEDGSGKLIDLALSVGDRLILGCDAVIGGVELSRETLLSVRSLSIATNTIHLETDDGRQLVSNVAALSKCGRKGKPPVLQHAFCVTPGVLSAASRKHVMWLVSQEDVGSALKAMTCHRDTLSIFIDRSDLPRLARFALQGEALAGKREEFVHQEVSDETIVAAMGQSLDRVEEPRNVADVIGEDRLEQEVIAALAPQLAGTVCYMEDQDVRMESSHSR